MAAAKKQSNRRGTAKTASGRKNTRKKQTRKQVKKQGVTSGFQTEIILLTILAASIILIISNLGMGGVVGAALLTVIYGMIFKNAMGVTTQHVWIMAAISAVGALISMVGDLTASAIKRNYEIKDYGKLIPGHGGILDRFDSVIFTAPMIYFLAANFIVL